MSETFEDSFIQTSFSVKVVPVLTDYRAASETVSLVVVMDTFEGKFSQTLTLTIFNNITYEQAFRKMFTDEYYKQPIYYAAYSWMLWQKEGIIYDLEILAANFCREIGIIQMHLTVWVSSNPRRNAHCCARVEVLANSNQTVTTSTVTALPTE